MLHKPKESSDQPKTFVLGACALSILFFLRHPDPYFCSVSRFGPPPFCSGKAFDAQILQKGGHFWVVFA